MRTQARNHDPESAQMKGSALISGGSKLCINQSLFEFCAYPKCIRPRAQIAEIQVLLLPGNDPQNVSPLTLRASCGDVPAEFCQDSILSRGKANSRRASKQSPGLCTPLFLFSMCCLERHDIDFGECLLIENIEWLAMLKRINPGICINEVVLSEQFGEGANLIRANIENNVNILCSPPTPIIRAGYGTTHIVGDLQAAEGLQKGNKRLDNFSEVGLHPARLFYPASSSCDNS